jgi:hypothetical protein
VKVIKIPLGHDEFAIVDEEDALAVLCLCSWKKNKKGYAQGRRRTNGRFITVLLRSKDGYTQGRRRRNGKLITVQLHLFIAARMGLSKNKIVARDVGHENGIKLDCTRKNLCLNFPS